MTPSQQARVAPTHEDVGKYVRTPHGDGTLLGVRSTPGRTRYARLMMAVVRMDRGEVESFYVDNVEVIGD